MARLTPGLKENEKLKRKGNFKCCFHDTINRLYN